MLGAHLQPPLLVSQRHHRIDVRGAASWNIACCQGHDQQEQRDRNERYWVVRAYAEKHAGEHSAHGGASCYPDESADQDWAHRLPQHEVHNLTHISAESHADADLPHASAYAVRHHPVYSDRGEYQCQGAKRSRKRSHNARGLAPNFKVVLKSRNASRVSSSANGHVFVERSHGLANAFCGPGKVSGVASQHVNAQINLWPRWEIEVGLI